MEFSIQWMADQYRKEQRQSQGLKSLADMGNGLGHPFTSRKYHQTPGIYTILNQYDKVIYVGQSKDVYRRMSEHVDNEWHDIWNHGATKVQYMIESDEATRLKHEKFLIALLDPVCNRQKSSNLLTPRPYGLAGIVPGRRFL
jgi:hypothetical protein